MIETTFAMASSNSRYRVSDEDKQYMILLHQRGMSSREIEQTFSAEGRIDWNVNTIRIVLQKAGVYTPSSTLIPEDEFEYLLIMRQEGLTGPQMARRLIEEDRTPRTSGVIQDALRNRGYPLIGNKQLEVVRGAQLAPIMRKWIDDYLNDRPIAHTDSSNINPFHKSSSDNYYGPIKVLSFRTGIYDRRVSMICNGRMEYVPLVDADALLSTIDMNYLLMDGTIEVIPNPYINKEAWHKLMEERGCV